MTAAEQLPLDQPHEVQYFPVGKTHIPFIEYGTPDEQPPFVLLHGISMPVTKWGRYPELLDRHTIAIGLPEESRRFELPTMGNYAKPVSEAIHGIAGDRYDLGGYSFGGILAQQLAVDDRKHIRRMVLMATMPMTPIVSFAIANPHATLAVMSPRRDPATVAKIYGGDALLDPAVLGEMGAGREIDVEKHLRQECAVFLAKALEWRRIAQWDKPDTLIVAGDKDPVIPYWAVRIGAAALGAKLETAHGDGHGILATRTDWLGKVTRLHLERPE